jgi:hypothetical protein
MPITHESRSYSLEYTIAELKTLIGPWKIRDIDASRTQAHRLIGTLMAAVKSKGAAAAPTTSSPLLTPLSIVQVEERSYVGTESTYQSRILIGSYVNPEHEPTLFDGSRTCQGLWCSSCWADDIYSSGNGGVLIPSFMEYRYFSSVQSLVGCDICKSRFRVFGTKTIPLENGCAYLFSSILNKKLQKEVEAVYFPLGITTMHVMRPGGHSLTPEECQAIVAESMTPKRISSLIEKYGFEQEAF